MNLDHLLKVAAACWEFLEDRSQSRVVFFRNLRIACDDELKSRKQVRNQRARQARFEEAVMRDIEKL